MATIGAKFLFLRQQLDLSQAMLADQLGTISASYLSYLETGQKTPSLTVVVQLARFFRVSTDAMLRDNIRPETLAIGAFSDYALLLDVSHVALNLRIYRTQWSMSQSELARQLGLAAPTFINAIEGSRKLPSGIFLVQLADYFSNVTDTFLLPSSIVPAK